MLNNALLSALSVLLILVSFPCVAAADSIRGTLDLNYSFFSSKTEDASGVTTKTDTNQFNPRFALNIEKTLFPNLRLNAGGIFEKNILDFESGETDSKTTLTRVRPYVDLTLNTPLYTAGVGYNRREEKQKSSGSPSFTNINEDYNAILGWRPEGFPSINMLFTKTNTFDEDRSFQDITRNSVSLNSKYGYKNIDLRYQGSFNDTKDKLNDLEILDLTHSGRAAYSQSFFDRRVSLYSSYNIFRQEIKTSSTGTGEVLFQVLPFAGLSDLDDSPTHGTLPANPALIDGNLTASSGINIGLPPLGGDTRPRNFGLDFLNVTEVNNLLVWVDRELPPDIANSFSWDIYTSADNLNWTFLTTASPAPFGPFQNRFEVNFPNVNARYIKLVVNPLSPAVPGAPGFPSIFITELNAFLRRPAQEARGKTTRTSHIFNLDTRSRIFNIPTLYYDLSYFFIKVDPEGQERYTLSNGFSVTHRFSRVFSGTARAAREDGEEDDEKRVAYVYNASITADPLKTLRHSLVFSGRQEEVDGKSNDRRSIFLYNAAQLYQGIDVNLSGGVNFTEQETGEKARNTTLNVGANIVPHRTLTLALNYSDLTTTQSGGDKRNSSTSTRRFDFSLNYNPFRTLHLFASLGITSEKDRDTEVLQNYGINWSPFPDGALQFNFTYNEQLRSEDSGKDRVFTPNVRWKVAPRAFLDLSYQWSRSESNLQKTNANGFNANLKIFF